MCANSTKNETPVCLLMIYANSNFTYTHYNSNVNALNLKSLRALGSLAFSLANSNCVGALLSGKSFSAMKRKSDLQSGGFPICQTNRNFPWGIIITLKKKDVDLDLSLLASIKLFLLKKSCNTG